MAFLFPGKSRKFAVFVIFVVKRFRALALLQPEMDRFMDYGGTMFWVVLYSGGWSHCAVLIGDFGF